MSLTIQLTIEDETRMAIKAKNAGVDLPTYVERVLRRRARITYAIFLFGKTE